MPIDPATGQALPDSAIQRVVFVANNVHVYGIPPLTSTKGFSAGSWTAPPNPTAQQIFTARLRVIETSVNGAIKADVVLEDGNSGDLFAAAPYNTAAAVQQANDSSRFFAVRVVGEGGMKATLGIGFEDRSPALDFNIALGEIRKILNWEGGTGSGSRVGGTSASQMAIDMENKKDFSLKEGEKIHIQVGSRGRRSAAGGSTTTGSESDSSALFSIAPPPSIIKSSNDAFSNTATAGGKSAAELGFDDGEFGEFQ